jgi:lipoic acid synthetase
VPEPPDSGEPERVAEAVHALGLRYAVITSVTRDDLPDGGAGHFAATIAAIRGIPECLGVEVLVPDFLGDSASVDIVLEACPDVFNHNIETVPRLYDAVRPEADYRRSLDVLGMAGKVFPQNRVKSGLMLGLGETGEEVRAVLGDLLGAGCGLLTIGQYLAPSRAHHPVARFVPPEEFERWREEALGMGFTAVASGPYVRSSYRAEYLWHQDTDTDTDANANADADAAIKK